MLYLMTFPLSRHLLDIPQREGMVLTSLIIISRKSDTEKMIRETSLLQGVTLRHVTHAVDAEAEIQSIRQCRLLPVCILAFLLPSHSYLSGSML